MRFLTRCMLFLACWAHALATPAVIEEGGLGGESSVRDPKLLFKFITIVPEACASASGAYNGVCYSAADCTTLAGTADGTCAQGLGVCCLINRTCGQSSGFRETRFVNPNFPAAQTSALGSCRLRITPLNNNICQLRLDFTELDLSAPDNEGVCDQDFLKVTGGSSSLPTICGENTGQHMYVDVSPQFGSALINVDTSIGGAEWDIRVTQIECNSSERAPSGCLQYFNSTTGTFSSFNFAPTGGAAGATDQLAGQVYGICIQSQPGYCSVTYRQATGSDFSLSGDPTALEVGVPRPGLVGDVECTVDYLLIPGGEIPDTTNLTPAVNSADRFCGLLFPTSVTTSVQPFNVFFVSNEGEATEGDGANEGFSIMYRMNAC